MESNIKMNLQPVTIETANERQKLLLEQTYKAYGQYPRMQLIMANMPSLLQMYLEGMATFRSEGLFSPTEQEIIFMIISLENECYYCLYAHSMIAEKKSGVSNDIINCIMHDKMISDFKLQSLVNFTKAIVRKKGFISIDDVSAFIEAEYTELHILSIIQALSLKTISNYTNHIFQTGQNNVLKKKLLGQH
jgi:AhpD family alkylhydroperoxidase